MNIQIKSTKSKKNLFMVTGETNIGELSGVWKSDVSPVEGVYYSAELTLPSLDEESISFLDQNTQPTVHIKTGENIVFRGRCEAIDEDDIYVIRFDTDWIEMIETPKSGIKIGDMVEFSVPIGQIEIYPVRY